MAEIILTDANFDETINGSDKPILVDFWAAWCGPCRMVGPIIEEVANEMDGKAVIGKVNVDENQETSAKYQVSAIPTILIFKDGKVAETLVGLRTKEDYISALNKLA